MAQSKDAKAEGSKPLTGKAKEDYDKRVAAQTDESAKPKRRSLTPQERIAKLEAELAAAREKANARGLKQLEQLDNQLKALKEKRDELDAKIESVQAERDTVAKRVNTEDEDGTDEAPAEDENAA